MGENSSRAWHIIEPLLVPALKLAAPFVLRYLATWWLRRRREQLLSRRQYLIIWALVLAAVGRARGPRPQAHSGPRTA